MAAGLGFKTFTTGEVLTAGDVNGYLMQGVLVFASTAARDAAITSPQEGQFAYLKDTNVTTYYTGSAWANLDTTGMTNPMTTTGDTIYSSSGSTPARLGIGTTGQVLTVASGIPSWATPAGGAFSGCSVFKDSTTSVPNATEVFIDFNDESFDTDSFHSNVTNPERITIPAGKGGKYQLNARITTSSTQATALSLYLIKNAGTYIGECTIDMQRGGTVQIAQLLSAVATDYFRIMIYQQSGATITMNSGQQGTNFSMAFLGA
jgi:hypothetical protein